MSRLATILASAGLFLYPLAVYFGIQYFQPRLLAGLLFVLVALRFLASHFAGRIGTGKLSTAGVHSIAGLAKDRWVKAQGLLAAFFVLAVILYSAGSNEIGALKFYPLVVSVYLLASFSYSLVVPPTVIERIARLSNPQLSAAGIRYTRSITMIWCGFFVFNALMVLYSIYLASFEFWALYNGFVSYLLIGVLLGGEYLCRNLILQKDLQQKD